MPPVIPDGELSGFRSHSPECHAGVHSSPDGLGQATSQSLEPRHLRKQQKQEGQSTFCPRPQADHKNLIG